MKNLIILILFVNVYINTFAQSESENMIKYWHYRNRLKYFVIPGTKQGESEIIGIRNIMVDEPLSDSLHKNSNIGQHGVYLGYYLGVLATEYKLLSDNGQNIEAAKTLEEIDLALDQFRTYMDFYAEGYWGETDAENGFFVSDNMPNNPCDFMDTTASDGHTINGEKHLVLLNKNLTTNNVWDISSHTFHGLPPGHPGYSDFINARMCTDTFSTKNPMSQDEAIGVLQGLAFINKFCPSLENTTKNIACNIITYIRNEGSYHGQNMWQIYLPDGQIDPGGTFGTGDACRFAWGFVQASDFFDNSCISNYTDPECDYNIGSDELLWQSEGWLPNPWAIYNDNMKVTLAAIGKSWYIDIPIIIGYCPIWCYDASIHIPATGLKIHHLTSINNNETFYLLLYDVLRSKNTMYLWKNRVTGQLNSAPCEGPYNYGGGYDPPDDGWGGWSSSYRWRNSIFDQRGGTGTYGVGNFNGLDYMLFYNLYHIHYGGISYESYNCRYLTGTVTSPINYIAFDSLFSTQTINNSVPIVNYKAGKQIELKPGFHALPGSDFHAFIGPTGCGESIVTDTTTTHPSQDPYDEISIITDTIPCPPDTIPGANNDTLHFNGIDGDTANLFHYQWNFSQNANPPSSNIMNPTVILDSCGLYRMSLIVTRDSTDSTAAVADTINFNIYKTCCDTSGGKKLYNKSTNYPLSNYEIKLFPNPTTGTFNVTCSDNNLQFAVEVSDVIGNILYYVKNAKGNVPFDLSLRPKGMYFVKVNTLDGKIYYRKIIHN